MPLIDLDAPAVQSAVGSVVGVSQQAVSSLMAEGKIPEGMSLGETILAYCQRLREQAAGRLGAETGGLDLSQERAALAREMRMGHEIKNAVARGTYAPIELLAQVLALASQSVVERFDQLPSLLKKACPNLSSEESNVVMGVLNDARNEWVRTTEKLAVQKLMLTDDDLDDDVQPPSHDDPLLPAAREPS